MYTKNKNLRRISVVVTAQTLYHLRHMAAMNGWGDKDIGRVIDKLVRSIRNGGEYNGRIPEHKAF